MLYKAVGKAKLMGILLSMLFIFSSCNHGGDDKKPEEQQKNDPEPILRKIKIGGKDAEEIEVKDQTNVEYTVEKLEITTEDIFAWFDYGGETGEKLPVRIRGGVFKVDKTKPTVMYLEVAPRKGHYARWTGSVTVKIGIIDMEDIAVGYDLKIQESGRKEELKVETVDFVVQSKEDIVKEVIVNDGSKDYNFKLEERQNAQGSKLYGNSLFLLLNTEQYTKYKITIKPKDVALYREKVVSYELKGTKIPNNNAEFMYAFDGTKDDADIVFKTKWKEGCESDHYEDYGIISLEMLARTVSPRAHVYVKFVDPINNQDISGTEIQLTYKDGVHTGTVTPFTNKPTKFVAYVKAEDGSTMNNEKGKWETVFNLVDLFYDTDEKKLETDEKRKSANKAYETIEITKTGQTPEKIYIAFSIWDQDIGFKPADSVTKLSDYKVLDTVGKDEEGKKTAYQFSIDIKDKSAGAEEDIKIPIVRFKDNAGGELENPIEAFEYIVKVKIK